MMQCSYLLSDLGYLDHQACSASTNEYSCNRAMYCIMYPWTDRLHFIYLCTQYISIHLYTSLYMGLDIYAQDASR